MGKPTPLYQPWLRDVAAKSTHPFTRDSERMIQYLFDLSADLPSEYGWRVTSVEGFRIHAATAGSKDELSRIYWRDTARTIEAFGITTIWRATELLQPALRSLNEQDILLPAIAGRSLLELAAAIIVDGNIIANTIKDIYPLMSDRVVISDELEALLIRLVHGTRLSTLPDNPRQKSALTYIQRLAKSPAASDLLPIYEYLCELAHPNVIGNARFWAALEGQAKDGTELLKLHRRAESPTTIEIREKTLWALGWSAASIRNGFEITQASVRLILAALPK